MKTNSYYSTGEFAKRAKVSIRTIRYYDKEGILKPTYINEVGYRFYTDADFAKLQKIQTLKYLGFSLEEIIDLTINDNDYNYITKSFEMQLDLVRQKIEHLQLVEQSIIETSKYVQDKENIDWEHMIHLIQVMNMEKSIIEQYKSASNLKIRIKLHSQYSTNKIGWYPWIFSKLELKPHQKVLEIGCGDGEMWRVNENLIPKDVDIKLTDISEGMVNAARESLDHINSNISFQAMDCHEMPFEDGEFDIIIANHVLFYLKDLDKALSEIKRVMKPNGIFICSTYGRNHMKEVTEFTKEFDPRINLSEVDLYEIFGLENGDTKLNKYFTQVTTTKYEDSLILDEEQLLIDYVLSCHGNQKEYIVQCYQDFKEFLHEKIMKKGYLKITKDAGVFICKITK
ncbi:MerR family transcriptional regulator [Anaeromicropila herbilytica]|uniref:HTH merR-type domain-containing protein n=1 Tax=Anaeromicropila herbilytica TaxID=2785025 RepID=A0A7R7EMF9_9FIRM|nr:methyltransferase domain-containing protein [Anaeromicropila herbilytica]BCN31280.1 hypothetical protein bsdtb5_25750 [Anaeromicropila herbilytica]